MLSFLELTTKDGIQAHLRRSGPGRIYSYKLVGEESGEWTFGEDEIEEIVSSNLQACVRVTVSSTRFNLEGMIKRHEQAHMGETRFIERRDLRSRWGSWQWKKASADFFD
jgi:hypothetical protein